MNQQYEFYTLYSTIQKILKLNVSINSSIEINLKNPYQIIHIINNQINKIYDNVILVFDIQGYNFNIKTYDNASNDELDNYKYFIQHYIENS